MGCVGNGGVSGGVGGVGGVCKCGVSCGGVCDVVPWNCVKVVTGRQGR